MDCHHLLDFTAASMTECQPVLAQDQGAQVTVLEAQNRVGGRVLTQRPSTAEAVDLGAWCFHGSSRATKDPDALQVLIG